MCKIAVILLLLFVIESLSACPRGETFSVCSNASCQRSCDNPYKQTRCSETCEPGCVCEKELYRNATGSCVSLEECESCAENERHFPCDHCLSSCNPAQKCASSACDRNTEVICDCKEGFARDSAGRCIPKERCPPMCGGANEHFACGSACDTECDTVGERCPIVNVKCNEKCYCERGYARDDRNACVPLKDCPVQKCNKDRNATLAECHSTCPNVCALSKFKSFECVQNDDCTQGCNCKPGYSLDRFGKCVLPSDCNFECGRNEVYDDCPPLCPPERTCQAHFSGILYKCAATTSCRPACRCLEGFVRNDKGVCVRPESCCEDANSELVRHPNMCSGGTCEKPEAVGCYRGFAAYGCQCKTGFVKISEYDTKCVELSACPKSD